MSDTLHPNGERCTCHGEGHCLFCRWAALAEHRDEREVQWHDVRSALEQIDAAANKVRSVLRRHTDPAGIIGEPNWDFWDQIRVHYKLNRCRDCDGPMVPVPDWDLAPPLLCIRCVYQRTRRSEEAQRTTENEYLRKLRAENRYLIREMRRTKADTTRLDLLEYVLSHSTSAGIAKPDSEVSFQVDEDGGFLGATARDVLDAALTTAREVPASPEGTNDPETESSDDE